MGEYRARRRLEAERRRRLGARAESEWTPKRIISPAELLAGEEDTRVSVIGWTEEPRLRDRIEDAILARCRGERLAGPGREYEGVATFSALAGVLNASRGKIFDMDGAARVEAVRLAASSGDLALSLGNIGSKLLLERHEHANPAYRVVGAFRELRDFRPHRTLRPADLPAPALVGEGGEVQRGSVAEAVGEDVQAMSYLRLLVLPIEDVLADDVGSLRDLARGAGARVADLEDSLFFRHLVGPSGVGPTLRDGNPLFHSSRGNLAAAPAVISATSISAARAAMMGQTSPSGVKSVAVPRYLVVPPALVTLAETEVAKLAPGTTQKWRLEVVPAVNLGGRSWYLAADPAERAGLVYGNVAGRGVSMLARPGFRVDGIEFRLEASFGVAVADPGAWYLTPGS